MDWWMHMQPYLSIKRTLPSASQSPGAPFQLLFAPGLKKTILLSSVTSDQLCLLFESDRNGITGYIFLVSDFFSFNIFVKLENFCDSSNYFPLICLKKLGQIFRFWISRSVSYILYKRRKSPSKNISWNITQFQIICQLKKHINLLHII